MSSVMWHRPQCNIGPGMSPVTISTMDDSRKRPESPGLASPTRRWRVNDEMNAHRMLRAITADVMCGRSGGRHVKRYSHRARFRYDSGGASARGTVASTGITAKTSTSAAPTVQTFEKLADILRPLLEVNCSFVTAVSWHAP